METGSNKVMINYSNGKPRNLIYEYGIIAIEYIKNHAMTYIGHQTRKSQNSIQVYHFISNSVTEAAHLNIVAESHKYKVQGTPVDELLFKFLIQEAVIDTRATDSCLREKLANLETYITTVNSNIDTFNQHVKVNVEGLNTRGYITDDIMTKLFKA